jgi:exopolysaccharide biosynthesis protein
MKFHAMKTPFFCLAALLLASANFYSQSMGTTLTQDPKFEQLLNEKRRINSSITVNDKYKIQIFNGDSENSKKTLTAFRNDFKNLDATIVFSTPAYKVWVGSFKSRIEAERNLAELQKKYPNAIIIRPNK